MAFLGDAINDVVKGTTNITLLFAGIVAVAFVAGMFYGLAFQGDNTFWWPVYVLVFILLLRIFSSFSK